MNKERGVGNGLGMSQESNTWALGSRCYEKERLTLKHAHVSEHPIDAYRLKTAARFATSDDVLYLRG